MIYVYQIGMFMILGFLLPTLVGVPFAVRFRNGKAAKLCYAYATGTFELIAIFEILQSIDLFIGQSLKLLIVVFLGIAIFLCGRSIVLCLDEITEFLEGILPGKKDSKSRQATGKVSVEYRVVVFIFLILVVAQIFTLVWFRDVQFGDNYFHTAAIVDAVETGKIWRVEPGTGREDVIFYIRHRFGGWDMYLAYLSTVTKTVPAVLTYTLEPVMALLWIYSVIVCLAVEIFCKKTDVSKTASAENGKVDNGKSVNGETKAAYFCVIMAVLMVFGQYNYVSTNGYFMNLPWAGRGLLYGVCVLWTFFLTLREFPAWNLRKEYSKAELKMNRELTSISWEGTLLLFIVNVVSVSMSLMCFQIILPMELILYFIYILRQRRLFSAGKMFIVITPQIFAIAVFLYEKMLGL